MLESSLKPVLSKYRSVTLALRGEAGVGKSYTVATSLKNLPCQSLSVHATLPFHNLVTQLPKSKRLSPWVLQTVQRIRQQEFVEDRQLLDVLASYLAQLAPFVLHLEDIHELSSERLETIIQLAKRIKNSKGLGLLVTSRVEPPEPFSEIRCSRLSHTESDQIIQQELKSQLPLEALEWIYQKAQGNPLYTLEYLRFLTRQGNLWNDGRSWSWRKPEGVAMPATVEALIELALSNASQNEQIETFLQSKALLPLESSELVCAVANLSTQEASKVSEYLQRQGVFIQDTFVHPLYRELSLQRLPKAKHQLLAKRAIDFFQDQPARAVTFLDEAQLDPDATRVILEKAIEQSKQENNHLQTGKLLSKLLELIPTQEQADIALQAASYLKYVSVNEAIDLAAQAAIDQRFVLKARLLQAELLAIQGHLAEAITLWQQLEPKQAPESYLTGLIRIHGVAHDYSGVVTIYDSSPESFLQTDAATTQLIVRGLAQLGRLELARKMIAKVTPNNDEDKILLLKAASDIAYTQANFFEMETSEAEIYKLAKNLGNLRVMDQALFNRALALEGLGRYEERKTCLEEAMRVCEALGDVTAYMIAQRAYGAVLADLGFYEQAEEYLLGARNYLESIDFYLYLLDCEITLSSFYREGHRPYANVLALKHARSAITCAKRTDNPSTTVDAFCTLAMAQIMNGHHSQAEQSLQEAIAALKGFELQQPQLSLLSVRAYLAKANGQMDKAKDFFEQAIQLAKSNGAYLEQQRLGLELDRLNNDVEMAQSRISPLSERGLVAMVETAKRLFPELSTIETPSKPSNLRLEVLGVMQLVQDSSSEGLRGRKRQELLAVLLETRLSGKTEISKLELLDLLYTNDDEMKASNNLRELIHVLRERFGTGVVVTTATGYALGDITSDAESFLQTGDSSLWRGVYLEDIDLDLSDTVAESLYLLLYSRAQDLLQTDPKEATRVGKILLEADPYNQDYLKLCLEALRHSKNHKSLNRLYAEAKQRFIELGEQLPEDWQGFLNT
jgi:tetratricopeptide (TPR) repeat protein